MSALTSLYPFKTRLWSSFWRELLRKVSDKQIISNLCITLYASNSETLTKSWAQMLFRFLEADTRGKGGCSQHAPPPLLFVLVSFFSEQLALSATTTTTTTIQYYQWYRPKWCSTPSILTIDLLFSLKFLILERSGETNDLFLKFFCYIIWFDERRHWTTYKRGVYIKSYCFLNTIA